MPEQLELRKNIRLLLVSARKLDEALVHSQPNTFLGRAIANAGPELVEEYLNQLDGFSALIREICFPTDGTAAGEETSD